MVRLLPSSNVRVLGGKLPSVCARAKQGTQSNIISDGTIDEFGAVQNVMKQCTILDFEFMNKS
jgi:hypothetical protein